MEVAKLKMSLAIRLPTLLSIYSISTFTVKPGKTPEEYAGEYP
jgi:hypothetical protein